MKSVAIRRIIPKNGRKWGIAPDFEEKKRGKKKEKRGYMGRGGKNRQKFWVIF